MHDHITNQMKRDPAKRKHQKHRGATEGTHREALAQIKTRYPKITSNLQMRQMKIEEVSSAIYHNRNQPFTFDINPSAWKHGAYRHIESEEIQRRINSSILFRGL